MNVLVDIKTNKNPINQCYFIKCGVNWSLRRWNSLFYGTQNTFNDAISRPITYALIAPIIRYVSVIRSPNNTLIACIANFSAIICDCIKTKFQCAFDWYHCVSGFLFQLLIIEVKVVIILSSIDPCYILKKVSPQIKSDHILWNNNLMSEQHTFLLLRSSSPSFLTSVCSLFFRLLHLSLAAGIIHWPPMHPSVLSDWCVTVWKQLLISAISRTLLNTSAFFLIQWKGNYKIFKSPQSFHWFNPTFSFMWLGHRKKSEIFYLVYLSSADK